MTIGQRIAQKRKDLGLSQEGLGERLGLSRQAIYKWESGAALPEVEKLVALSRLFGVSVGWLLGLEEDTAPEAAAGELTEAQLKMVEEITARYVAAIPKPKPRRKWPFILTGVVLFFAILNLFQSLDALQTQQRSFFNDLSRVESSVNREINGISGRVEEILKAQNALTADYGTEQTAVDLSGNTVTFSLRAVPKTFAEGMRAVFLADNGAGSVEFPAERTDGQAFTAQATVEMTDSISLSVVFIAPDGTRQTQLLDTYDGLYSSSFPSGDVDDNLIWTALDPSGVLTLSGEARYIMVRPSQAPPFSDYQTSEAQVIQVGLFKNQTLVEWAEPCPQPESYHGDYSETLFYQLPELRLTLTASDQLHLAAVVTDEYGRVTIWPGIPYIPDAECRELTHPSYSDPRHWHFS